MHRQMLDASAKGRTFVFFLSCALSLVFHFNTIVLYRISGHAHKKGSQNHVLLGRFVIVYQNSSQVKLLAYHESTNHDK